MEPRENMQQATSETHAQAAMPRKVELPTLPIPKFKGNIWEWENFWELFNANVHSQELPELFKFNYLLDALQGEAKESVRKFQVTKDNYTKAIEYLHTRYGSGEELIQKLVDRLEEFQLRSQSLKDQRSLMEQMQVIIEQLRKRGEQVDSQWMTKKVLSKFPEELQQKVLKKRSLSSNQQPFSMQGLFDLMEEALSGEEMIHAYLDKEAKITLRSADERETTQYRKNRMFPCMYCKGDHKPAACGNLRTPQERAQYLREKGLCLLRASAEHATTDCKRQPCFRCKGLHHTSCCFKPIANQKASSTQPCKDGAHSKTQTQPERPDKRAGKKLPKTPTNVNLVTNKNPNTETNVEEPSQNEGIILAIQPASDRFEPRKTLSYGRNLCGESK
nr:Protein of unknown function DUF1759 domain containing protein [Haemonchus contortus]